MLAGGKLHTDSWYARDSTASEVLQHARPAAGFCGAQPCYVPSPTTLSRHTCRREATRMAAGRSSCCGKQIASPSLQAQSVAFVAPASGQGVCAKLPQGTAVGS